MNNEYDGKEPEYITVDQLKRKSLRSLEEGVLYIVAEKIEDGTVRLNEFATPTVKITGPESAKIYLTIHGAPKYHNNLFSLYAMMEAARHMAKDYDDWKIVSEVDDPEHLETMIEFTSELRCKTTKELLGFINNFTAIWERDILEYLKVKAESI